MAVLKGPLDWSLISRLSKDYDFYEEFGRTVVRIYPRRIRQPGTPPQRETWKALKLAQYDWDRMGKKNTDAWNLLTVGSQYRGRDYHTKLFLEEYAKRNYIESMCFLGTVWWAGAGYIIQTYTRPPFVPQMHWRYDAQEGLPSPARWSDIGHRIRNRRLLRKWQLSLSLPNLDTHPFCWAPGLCDFSFVPPHPGTTLWLWFESRPTMPLTYLRVSSGLYKIALPWPRP